MATDEPDLPTALAFQADACDRLGSPRYGELVRGLLEDFLAGGITHDLLATRPEPPVRDALALRYLGAVHRIVLRGDAPELAATYPSAGGHDAPIPVEEFLEVVRRHRPEVEAALSQNVQTNEVARACALIIGFATVSQRSGLPLSTFELGASAGLLSNWDRYGYDLGTNHLGSPDSPVQFTDRWRDRFDLAGLTPVAARAACDIAPLSAAHPDDRLRLLSFVWPDQTQRFAHLRGALEVHQQHPVTVQHADAGAFLARHLPERPAGVAAVVFHSIVWQYLPKPTKDHVRAVLRAQGEAATVDRPLAWVRLEPAGAWADVRLTYWPGGVDEVLAVGTHHGADLRQPESDGPSPGHVGVS